MYSCAIAMRPRDKYTAYIPRFQYLIAKYNLYVQTSRSVNNPLITVLIQYVICYFRKSCYEYV